MEIGLLYFKSKNNSSDIIILIEILCRSTWTRTGLCLKYLCLIIGVLCDKMARKRLHILCNM